MIIKRMQKRDFEHKHNNGVVFESWEYIPDILSFRITKPITKTSDGQDYLEGNVIHATTSQGSESFQVYDYDKIFLMSNEGKTIEVLRNIDRKRN